MIRVRVTDIEFSDGTTLAVPPEGVVLFVGPNNAGKSQALRDLNLHPRDQNYRAKTLARVTYSKEPTGDLTDWVTSTIPKVSSQGSDVFQVEGWGGVNLANLLMQLQQPELGVLTSIFVMHADGTSRLSAGDSQKSIDFSTEVPTHPVQIAYLNSNLEHQIETESVAAFGLGVTVDRFGGSVISLRLGQRPLFEHQDGRPTSTYLDALKQLPRLEDQGDGVRSYLGLVLHILAGVHQVLLIDEPEAFLHPPQARRLGEVLARKAQKQQAFVATHSTDVVQGALEADTAITIVRITREGDVNHAAVLNDDAVNQLWSDPLLRYSNVLDGLFHDAVVICESDADCRYYSAVLDHLSNVSPKDQSRPAQLLFTHCGGKARMHSVVDALRAVSVPVIVVADFDVLKEARDMERLVTSLGGKFEDFEGDLKIISAALEADTKPLRKLTLKDDFIAKIEDLPSETISRRDAEQLRSIIRADTGWDRAKRSGQAAVPQGSASEACARIILRLRGLRLLVVEVGELERFAPSVSGHGPRWVTEVLEQKLHEAPGRDAAEFVSRIRDAAPHHKLEPDLTPVTLQDANPQAT